MTRDDIIRMAREAGISDSHAQGMQGFLERFANLVAAAEREACAKVCEDMGRGHGSAFAEFDCAAAIRAALEQPVPEPGQYHGWVLRRTLIAKLVEGFEAQGWRLVGYGRGGWTSALRPLEKYIQSRIDKAVKAEREACAKVCEELRKDLLAGAEDYASGKCIDAIRARGRV